MMTCYAFSLSDHLFEFLLSRLILSLFFHSGTFHANEGVENSLESTNDTRQQHLLCSIQCLLDDIAELGSALRL